MIDILILLFIVILICISFRIYKESYTEEAAQADCISFIRDKMRKIYPKYRKKTNKELDSKIDTILKVYVPEYFYTDCEIIKVINEKAREIKSRLEQDDDSQVREIVRKIVVNMKQSSNQVSNGSLFTTSGTQMQLNQPSAVNASSQLNNPSAINAINTVSNALNAANTANAANSANTPWQSNNGLNTVNTVNTIDVESMVNNVMNSYKNFKNRKSINIDLSTSFKSAFDKNFRPHLKTMKGFEMLSLMNMVRLKNEYGVANEQDIYCSIPYNVMRKIKENGCIVQDIGNEYIFQDVIDVYTNKPLSLKKLIDGYSLNNGDPILRIEDNNSFLNNIAYQIKSIYKLYRKDEIDRLKNDAIDFINKYGEMTYLTQRNLLLQDVLSQMDDSLQSTKSIFDGLKDQMTNDMSFKVVEKKDINPGEDIMRIDMPYFKNPGACAEKCLETPNCSGFVIQMDGSGCILKKSPLNLSDNEMGRSYIPV